MSLRSAKPLCMLRMTVCRECTVGAAQSVHSQQPTGRASLALRGAPGRGLGLWISTRGPGARGANQASVEAGPRAVAGEAQGWVALRVALQAHCCVCDGAQVRDRLGGFSVLVCAGSTYARCVMLRGGAAARMAIAVRQPELCRACLAAPLHSAELVPPVLPLVEPTGQGWHCGLLTVLLPPAENVPLSQGRHWLPPMTDGPVPGGQVSE